MKEGEDKTFSTDLKSPTMSTLYCTKGVYSLFPTLGEFSVMTVSRDR